MSSCNTSKCIRSPDSPTTTPAPSLQCVSCTDPECTSTELVTCDSGSMCITASIQANLTGTAEQRIYMDCAPSALCPTTGNRNFSVNLGFSSATASALCCNTSNCNSETLPFPSPQSNNGLECFVCDPTTSVCDSTVQCSGDETNCFSANLRNESSTYPVQGCVNSNTFTAAGSLLQIPFLESLGSITDGPSSCRSSLCNSPTTQTPSATINIPKPTGEPAQSASSDASSVRLGALYLLLGLVIFPF
ncbi:threonine-rich protein-like isoform X2 [Kryptolebias marmoratus]|uniref:threonine-rich protein-like isoform X2 n=1 Tax=Kryptolebias marmoratus TaxID=37003 RepID=UPI0018ACB941|nr:threonine-rich protein-like isoform X2 [Kryptolebias marmoratus]